MAQRKLHRKIHWYEKQTTRVNKHLPTCLGNTLISISHQPIPFAQAKKGPTNSELVPSATYTLTK